MKRTNFTSKNMSIVSLFIFCLTKIENLAVMESGFVWWCCYLVENLEGNDACFRRKFPGDSGNVIY
jgi:hypothetical protein